MAVMSVLSVPEHRFNSGRDIEPACDPRLLAQVYYQSGDAEMVHHFSFMKANQDYLRRNQGNTEPAVHSLFRQVPLCLCSVVRLPTHKCWTLSNAPAKQTISLSAALLRAC